MPMHVHTPSSRGPIYLWAGVGLGVLLIATLLTKGFGLLGGPAKTAEEPAAMVKQGDKIFIPEGSPLRSRLSVQPAPAEAVSSKLVLPGVVESNPRAPRPSSFRSPAGCWNSKSRWATAWSPDRCWR